MKLNRRNFIRTGLIGAGSAVVSAPAMARNPSEPKNEKIVTRKLGNTGIELPVVNMGVMRSDNANLVRAALDRGMKHLDTAHAYQDGRNEEMLGRVLKDYDRDSFVISTKIKDRVPGDKNDKDAVKQMIRQFDEELDLSLERLQMDYVDILYVHGISDTGVLMYTPIIECLEKAKQQEKAKFVGLSTHANQAEVTRVAAESGVYEVVLVAYNFQQENRDEIGSAIDYAAERGLGIVAMKTMAGGYLDKERNKPVNCAAALKWVLQNKNVHTTIPGMTSFDMLEENARVMYDVQLKDKELKDLELAQRETGMYCQGCEQCLKGCSRHIPLPDMMRAYMYAYGYRQTGMARRLLDEVGIYEDPCSDCRICTAVCARGFDIREKASDIFRLCRVPEDFLT